jgi:hypothetical protein
MFSITNIKYDYKISISDGISSFYLINSFFSIVDIVKVLTDSKDPKDYWYRVKKRTTEKEKIELSTICRQLKLPANDGKRYNTDCANTE